MFGRGSHVAARSKNLPEAGSGTQVEGHLVDAIITRARCDRCHPISMFISVTRRGRWAGTREMSQVRCPPSRLPRVLGDLLSCDSGSLGLVLIASFELDR